MLAEFSPLTTTASSSVQWINLITQLLIWFIYDAAHGTLGHMVPVIVQTDPL